MCGSAADAALEPSAEAKSKHNTRKHLDQTICHAALGSGNAGPNETTAVPFINQTAGVPLSCCHKMSALPSPLKSAASFTCQVGPGLASAGPLESTLTPFMSHTAGVPSSFCHRTSALPSPLKSAASFACQVEPGLERPGPIKATPV